MKRVLKWAGAVLAVVLLAAAGARPASELVLFLKLNGSPYYSGSVWPGVDGGTKAIVDAGFNEVVEVQCDKESFQLAGQNVTNTTGRYHAAREPVFYVLDNLGSGVAVMAADSGIVTCPTWILK